MNYYLNIKYSDGREDYYVLTSGERYILGSSNNCGIAIQEAGIADKHLLFICKEDGVDIKIFNNIDSILFNDLPLVDRIVRFDIGDEVSVGNVRLVLKDEVSEEIVDAQTKDGVLSIKQSLSKIEKLGWRGYRKIIDKIAAYISPEEAVEAENWYRSSVKAFRNSIFFILICCGILVVAEEKYNSPSSIYFDWWIEYIAFFIIFLLHKRYGFKFAAKVFFPIMMIFNYRTEPLEYAYAEYIVFLVLVLFIGFGHLLDVGLSCITEEKKKKRILKYLLLPFYCVLLYVLLVWEYWVLPPEDFGPLDLETEISLGMPISILLLLWPVWSKIIRPKIKKSNVDSSFVAEIALRKYTKMFFSRILTCLLILYPTLLLLNMMGVGEKFNVNLDGIVSYTSESSVGYDQSVVNESSTVYEQNAEYNTNVAYDPNGTYNTNASMDENNTHVKNDVYYFFDSQKGRFFVEDDFEENNLYYVHVPTFIEANSNCELDNDKIEQIRNTEIYDEIFQEIGSIALKDYDISQFTYEDWNNIKNDVNSLKEEFYNRGGYQICSLIDEIQYNPTNSMAYTELVTILEPYRIVNEEQLLLSSMGFGLSFRLDRIHHPRKYSNSKIDYIYKAQHSIDVKCLNEEGIGNSKNFYQFCIPSLFVLLFIAGVILWKRGVDSQVGFWIGVYLLNLILYTVGCLEDNIGCSKQIDVSFQIWAAKSILGNISYWMIKIFQTASNINQFTIMLSVPIIFILLCWPSLKPVSNRYKKALIFIGKYIAILAAFLGINLLLYVLLPVTYYGDEILDGLVLDNFSAILVPIMMCAIGLLLRRKRRLHTEIPHLGFTFLVLWVLVGLCAEFPILALPLMTLESYGQVENQQMFCVILVVLPLLLFYLFVKYCLNKDFLNLLTFNELALSMLAFAVPLMCELVEGLFQNIFSDTVLHSKAGENIITVVIVVLFFSRCWELMQNWSRRIVKRHFIKVEKNVESAMITILDNEDYNADLREDFTKCFTKFGLDKFAIYIRKGKQDFELYLKKDYQSEIPLTFSISKGLYEYLVSRKHAIEMSLLGLNMASFFQSFELIRLERDLDAGYILPIKLGPSIRGFVVIPKERNLVVNNDVMVEELNLMGLAIVSSKK